MHRLTGPLIPAWWLAAQAGNVVLLPRLEWHPLWALVPVAAAAATTAALLLLRKGTARPRAEASA